MQQRKKLRCYGDTVAGKEDSASFRNQKLYTFYIATSQYRQRRCYAFYSLQLTW